MVGKLTPDDELSCSVLPQIIDPDFPYGTPAQALRRCLDAREGKEAESDLPLDSMSDYNPPGGHRGRQTGVLLEYDME